MPANRAIRILYLDHGTKPFGGGQANTLSIIRALNKARFTPVLLSASENEFTQGARDAGAEVIIMPLPTTLTRLGRNSVKYDPYHLALYGWCAARAAFRVLRIVRDRQIDI